MINVGSEIETNLTPSLEISTIVLIRLVTYLKDVKLAFHKNKDITCVERAGRCLGDN